MPKLKIVGGIVKADEKGNVEIPPAGALDFKMGKDFIEIPVSEVSRSRESQR